MKRVLLDIDGVIIRNKPLLGHVRNNIVRYVDSKVKTNNPVRLNELLFKAHGHTAKGLEVEFGIDTGDFNSFVYDVHAIDHLYEVLKSDEFKRDAEIVKRMGKNVSFFSNSPLVWSIPVRNAIDKNIHTAVYTKPEIKNYSMWNEREAIIVDDRLDNLLPALFFKNLTPIHFSEYKESDVIKTIYSLENILDDKL